MEEPVPMAAEPSPGTIEEVDEEEDYEDVINRVLNGRKMLTNANYYAFTATPKNKTLQMFGTPYQKPDGEIERRPFHKYTMKQAIEEGFIMDVLAHYTTYDSYYKLIKKVEDDPEFDKKQAMKKLRAFVEAQPDTIEKKASVIVEHFHNQVINKGKVGGMARAMVVTSSIFRAIVFYNAITQKLEERKSPYKAIVAFSGTKEWQGKEMSEADFNGFPSKDIEANMEKEPYRILVVADKFQTGYDQPLLHTMYVDKMLTDVKAVQTLSRLNRCHPKKKDTFVLDFCNSAEDIQKSFQRFYKTTILSKETDPNKLNDLIQVIEDGNIYTQEEVEEVNRLYWTEEAREKIDPFINEAVDRFNKTELADKIKIKSAIKGFLRTYSFLAAVLPFKSEEWEKLNTYYALLIKKLPVLKDEDNTQGLIEAISFENYDLVNMEEHRIQLENADAEINPIPVGTGGGKPDPEMLKLSEILKQFADVHITNIEKAQQQLDELPSKLESDQAFINAAQNSDKETAMRQASTSLLTIVAQMLNENTEFCRGYLDNPNFMNFINQRVFNAAYQNISKAG